MSNFRNILQNSVIYHVKELEKNSVIYHVILLILTPDYGVIENWNRLDLNCICQCNLLLEQGHNTNSEHSSKWLKFLLIVRTQKQL
jgi:hypothetical protein